MVYCLFVTEKMIGVNLSVSWLQSRPAQQILFQISHLSWLLKLTLNTGRHSAVGLIVTFFWHYLIAEASGFGNWISLFLWFGDKKGHFTVKWPLTTRVYLFSWRCSVTVLLKTYSPVTQLSNHTINNYTKLKLLCKWMEFKDYNIKYSL